MGETDRHTSTFMFYGTDIYIYVLWDRPLHLCVMGQASMFMCYETGLYIYTGTLFCLTAVDNGFPSSRLTD